MWLHIPSLSLADSTSSAFAPEAQASTSGSSWQSDVLASSAWWRGKPSPSPIWSRRCAKVSWLKRLSGAMCEPSQAAHGVALWMASLAESRASPTLSPASGSAPTMSATFGATPAGSSARRGRGSSSSKTSAGCSQAAAPSASSETFADLVIRLRSDYSARQKSARATSGSESSSSQWPTARAWDSEGGPDPAQAWRQGAGGPTLTMLAANWPTPDAAISNDGEDPETFLARQDRQKARGINGNGMGTPLAMAAKLWPSKNNWPTPQARDGDPSGRAADPSRVGDPARHGGYNLDDWAAKFADQWPTPMAVNHRSIYASENTCGKNARPLQEFVGRWMTPRVSETGQ
jgi:hypothetical protein